MRGTVQEYRDTESVIPGDLGGSMEDKIVIVFNILKRDMSVDLEIPLGITTRELVIGLNKAFDLGIDTSDIKQCYLKAENPIALLRGNKLLGEYGLRNGSIINFTE